MNASQIKKYIYIILRCWLTSDYLLLVRHWLASESPLGDINWCDINWNPNLLLAMLTFVLRWLASESPFGDVNCHPILDWLASCLQLYHCGNVNRHSILSWCQVALIFSTGPWVSLYSPQLPPSSSAAHFLLVNHPPSMPGQREVIY